MSSQTMIYVGSLATAPDRDGGWIKAFEALGWTVIPVSSDVIVSGPVLWRKLAQRFHLSNEHRRMRRQLVALCRQLRPAWVHFRLPLAFTKGDIQAIRATGAVVTEYFNDDPFSPHRVPGLQHRFLRTLPAFDAHYVYRNHNIASFARARARHVEHCPPALDASRLGGMDRETPTHTMVADATFIGHFERDGRLGYLEALQNAGIRVAVHGSGWAEAIVGGPLAQLHPAAPIFGAGYGELYARSRCGLCFFSKLNRDTWTERPLEIIAAGGLLVCERTDEAMEYFRDGEEALFFSSPDELVGICRAMKADPERPRRIREAGHARLFRDERHFLSARAKQVEAFVTQHIRQHD